VKRTFIFIEGNIRTVEYLFFALRLQEAASLVTSQEPQIPDTPGYAAYIFLANRLRFA
jgi:hypothetical protein